MSRWKKRAAICIALLIGLLVMDVGLVSARKKGKILARVNKEVLTLKEFTKQFQNIGTPYGRSYEEGGESTVPRDMGEDVVKQWIETQLLFQEAKRRKIDRRADILKKVEEVKKHMVTQTLVQEETSKVEVSDDEAQDYFERYKGRFYLGKLRLKHILVKTREKSDELQERLSKGEKFEDLAREASRDAESRDKGGDMGLLNRRDCVRRYGGSFARAAYSLKKGEISEPVRTRSGFHLIKLEGKEQPDQETMERARERAKRGALREKRIEAREGFIKGLREKAHVEMNLELLGPTTEEKMEMERKLDREREERIRREMEGLSAPEPPK